MNIQNLDIVRGNQVNIPYLSLRYTKEDKIAIFLKLRQVSSAFKNATNKVYPKLSEMMVYINVNYRYNNSRLSRPLTLLERWVVWICQRKIYNDLNHINVLRVEHVNSNNVTSDFLEKIFFLENTIPSKRQYNWKTALAKRMENQSSEGNLLLISAKENVEIFFTILLGLFITLSLTHGSIDQPLVVFAIGFSIFTWLCMHVMMWL